MKGAFLLFFGNLRQAFPLRQYLDEVAGWNIQ